MDLLLEGKRVLVTGGASGIGAAAARLFAAEGCSVIIVDRQATGMDQASGPGKLRSMQADLTDEGRCEKVVADAVKELRGLDILINNAGGNDHVGLGSSPAEFRAALDRNLVQVFSMTHFATPHLKESVGSIVNVGSKVAVTGQGNTSGYVAAKGAIHALTREWALELAPWRVRVNCVVPAECATPGYQRWFDAQEDPAAARKSIERLIPLGNRMTTPEEIAAAIVFLASPRSAHTTGQLLFVDGGYTHLDRAVSAKSV